MSKTNFVKAFAKLQVNGKVWIKTTQVESFLNHAEKEFGLSAMRGEYNISKEKQALYI